ncbi:MAG TPA: 2Fe-2S iron-sulfur cluster-binding protein, partial [Acidimicrobiales bacterium]|nr:2Fe-2S iron-sulfur cluster-binding protein [Acidimicrobiales bacterium]
MALVDVELRVKRFNPDVDDRPHWESYRVRAEPTDRVLDVLHTVRWEQDGTLAFRRSCAHGVCGSDAMMINGANALACIELVRDAAGPEGGTVTVEAI